MSDKRLEPQFWLKWILVALLAAGIWPTFAPATDAQGAVAEQPYAIDVQALTVSGTMSAQHRDLAAIMSDGTGFLLMNGKPFPILKAIDEPLTEMVSIHMPPYAVFGYIELANGEIWSFELQESYPSDGEYIIAVDVTTEFFPQEFPTITEMLLTNAKIIYFMDDEDRTWVSRVPNTSNEPIEPAALLTTLDHNNSEMPLLGIRYVTSNKTNSLSVEHTIALDRDGQLWGWGTSLEGLFGELDLQGFYTEIMEPDPANTVPDGDWSFNDWTLQNNWNDRILQHYKNHVANYINGDLDTADRFINAAYRPYPQPIQLPGNRRFVDVVFLEPYPVTNSELTTGLVALDDEGDLWQWGMKTLVTQEGYNNNYFFKKQPFAPVQLDEAHVSAKRLYAQNTDALIIEDVNGAYWCFNGYCPGGSIANEAQQIAGLDNVYRFASSIKSIDASSTEQLTLNGNGTLSAIRQPNLSLFVPEPQRATVSSSVYQIGANSQHFVLLRDEGTLLHYSDDYGGREIANGVSAMAGSKFTLPDQSHYLIVKEDGTVEGFGKNTAGQVGPGNTTTYGDYVDNWQPVYKNSEQTERLDDIIDVAAGNNFSLALSSDKQVWGWGTNTAMQLAQYYNPDPLLPLIIYNESPVKAIAASDGLSVLLLENGRVLTAGSTSNGKRGNSAASIGWSEVRKGTGSDNSPLENIVEIAVGTNHVSALDESGNVWFWGQYSPYNNHSFAQQVMIKDDSDTALQQIKQITAGKYFTLALDERGELWSWGMWNSNSYSNSMVESSAPTDRAARIAPAYSGIKQVTAGAYHSFMIDSNDVVWAWGSNSSYPEYIQSSYSHNQFMNLESLVSVSTTRLYPDLFPAYRSELAELQVNGQDVNGFDTEAGINPATGDAYKPGGDQPLQWSVPYVQANATISFALLDEELAQIDSDSSHWPERRALNAKHSVQPLSVGSNSFAITIKAENGALRSYLLDIVREEPDDNTALSTLTLNGNTVAGFAPGDADGAVYTETVPFSVKDAIIEAGVASDTAVVAIAGAATGTHTQPLSVGSNTIVIAVEAENGAIATYTIEVTRAKASGGSGGIIWINPDASRDNEQAAEIEQAIQAARAATITLGDEIEIRIPAGAGENDWMLSVSKLTGLDEPPAADHPIVSSVFELLKTFDGSFSKPVVIRIKYDASLLGDGERPSIFYYDEIGRVWIELGGDSDSDSVWTEVDHFTKFAVLAVGGAAENETLAFSDTNGHWAEEAIKEAAARGFVSGFPNGTFEPDSSLSRAQLAAMLTAALRLQASDQLPSFADSIAPWAQAHVAGVVQAGLMTGYEDGTFRGDKAVTRAELAVVLARAAKVSVPAHAAGFADDGDIPSWAEGAVAAAKQLGLLTGRAGNRFAPGETATRAEAAIILVRLHHILETK